MLRLQYRTNDYTNSMGNVSNMDRAGGSCETSRVSSIEETTITVVLGTCPAWSGPAILVIYAASPSDCTNSNESVSSVEPGGSGCYRCSVSSIEEAAILVVKRMCPTWSGPEEAVIHADSPV